MEGIDIQTNNDLNEAQAEAVRATEGPLFIIAGPGSGKTKTLVDRIVYLVLKGTPAEKHYGGNLHRKSCQRINQKSFQ